ncbi:MAG: hypothetical protein ACREL4_04490 [Gemmatimonadales bacterium]
MSKRRLLVPLLCAGLALGSCKSTDPSVDVTGSWSGTGEGWTLKMDLTQNGTTVTGTGTLIGVGTYPLTIHGGANHSVLSVGLSDPGYYSATYSGTVDGDHITGTMDNSGFENVPLVEMRQ